MEENPYRPPEVAEVAAEEIISDPGRIRREHLRHEASLKGAGTLMILGGLLSGIALLMVIPGPKPGTAWIAGSDWMIVAVFGIMLVGQLGVGIGLRSLRPWSWIPAIIVSALSLINFPLGTLIGAYFLFLLISPKGRRILARDYREIVRQTPDIRYRTPLWLWILLLLIVLAVVGSLMFFAIG